jgi:hypothetical protein
MASTFVSVGPSIRSRLGESGTVNGVNVKDILPEIEGRDMSEQVRGKAEV